MWKIIYLISIWASFLLSYWELYSKLDIGYNRALCLQRCLNDPPPGDGWQPAALRAHRHKWISWCDCRVTALAWPDTPAPPLGPAGGSLQRCRWKCFKPANEIQHESATACWVLIVQSHMCSCPHASRPIILCPHATPRPVQVNGRKWVWPVRRWVTGHLIHSRCWCWHWWNQG